MYSDERYTVAILEYWEPFLWSTTQDTEGSQLCTRPRTAAGARQVLQGRTINDLCCSQIAKQDAFHIILQISYYRSLTASQLGIYDIYSRKETKNYKSHLLSPTALERTTTLSLPRSSQLKPRCKKLSCAEERNAICSLFQRWGHWVVVHKGQVQM